ncbi:hypothetical protein BU16DRAFT_583382 [Lophium mytilinum]|uniref:Uncharacterized protein n=1 Tax=Lophium mytilinum TaxID=390894 RepID=A0A6A6QLA3_9PEZI|nr:hypothetical protein BU16DRAFT_583382 [Lophium mytilinum]
MASSLDWQYMDEFTMFSGMTARGVAGSGAVTDDLIDIEDAAFTLSPSLEALEEKNGEFEVYQAAGAGSPQLEIFRGLGYHIGATSLNLFGDYDWEGRRRDTPYSTVTLSSTDSSWSSGHDGRRPDGVYSTDVPWDNNWSGYHEGVWQVARYPEGVISSTESNRYGEFSRTNVFQETEKDDTDLSGASDSEAGDQGGSEAGDENDSEADDKDDSEAGNEEAGNEEASKASHEKASDAGDSEASEFDDEVYHESDCGPDVDSDEEVLETTETPITAEPHHTSNKSETPSERVDEEGEEQDFQHPYRNEGQYRVYHHSPYGKSPNGSTVHNPGSPKLDFNQLPRESSTPDLEDLEDECDAVRLHKSIRDSPSNRDRTVLLADVNIRPLRGLHAGGKLGGTGMAKLATLLRKDVLLDTLDSGVGGQSRGGKRSRPDDGPLHGVPNMFAMSLEGHKALVAREAAKRKERDGDSDSEDEEEEEAKLGKKDAERWKTPKKKRARQTSEEDEWWDRWDTFKGDRAHSPFFGPAYGSRNQDGSHTARSSSVEARNGAKSPREGSGSPVELIFTCPGHFPNLPTHTRHTSASSRTVGRTPSVPGSFPTSPGFDPVSPSHSSRVSTNVYANGSPVAPGYFPASPIDRSSPDIKVEDVDEYR